MAKRHSRRAFIGEYQPYHSFVAVSTAIPVGKQVNTSASTAVAAPGSVTITPASTQYMVLGMPLQIYGGTGTPEQVFITGLTATTFTAVFANTHSGTYNINSIKCTFIGAVVVNTLWTTGVTTLYNGNPNATPAGTSIAVINTTITSTWKYDGVLDFGLWFTAAGTPGDTTIMYLDEY